MEHTLGDMQSRESGLANVGGHCQGRPVFGNHLFEWKTFGLWNSCGVIGLTHTHTHNTLQCNFMVRSLTSAIVIFWSYVLDTLSHSVKYQKHKSIFISFYPQNCVNTYVHAIYLVGYSFGSTFCGLGSPYNFMLQVCHFLLSVLPYSLSSFNMHRS